MATRSDNYPTKSHTATPALRELIRDRITKDGPLDFASFMAMALYHPGLGYYARQTRQVGRSGDFFTSVSVGPLFGRILARRFLRGWHDAGSPPRWRLIECGANDGSLANDILTEISAVAPQAAAALEFAIIEPLPHLRTVQESTLAAHRTNVRIVPDATALAADPLPGIAFGNEVLDALPCHALIFQNGAWHERLIALAENGGFQWQSSPSPLPAALASLVAGLGSDFPEGYLTEVRTNYPEFLAPLRNALSSGRLIWFDYGFARPEFFHPDRTCGTLRTYTNHRAGEDALDDPGGIDLTAHVDFTAVAAAAASLHCPPVRYQSQGAWLTHEAREILIELENSPTFPQAALAARQTPTIRQFQTLTHPAQLGSRFQVLELAWNEPSPQPLPTIDRHRLAWPDEESPSEI
jgi:SAM-dependent MidA family methyltransferase